MAAKQVLRARVTKLRIRKGWRADEGGLPRVRQVLVSKCLARRMCSACGKNFNLADIDLPASASGEPAVKMPPLLPPPGCARGACSGPPSSAEDALWMLPCLHLRGFHEGWC